MPHDMLSRIPSRKLSASHDKTKESAGEQVVADLWSSGATTQTARPGSHAPTPGATSET